MYSRQFTRRCIHASSPKTSTTFSVFNTGTNKQFSPFTTTPTSLHSHTQPLHPQTLLCSIRPYATSWRFRCVRTQLLKRNTTYLNIYNNITHQKTITSSRPLNTTSRHHFASSSSSEPPTSSGRFTAEEEKMHREIERWGSSFDISAVRKDFFDFAFVRSSGPGGQNVNKVSSKAQLRFILDDAHWIHAAVRKRIKEQHDRYVTVDLVTKKNEFLIQSDVHRTQEQNIDECIRKIYDVIKSCCAVPKETSEAQKKKVQKLIEVQKKKDIEYKKKLKEKKSDRRGNGRD